MKKIIALNAGRLDARHMDNLLTFDEALNLQYGDILLDPRNKRWKVSGMVKTWKRSPERIRVPLKHGLYTYDALTEADFGPEGKCLLRKESQK